MTYSGCFTTAADGDDEQEIMLEPSLPPMALAVAIILHSVSMRRRDPQRNCARHGLGSDVIK